MKNIIKYGLLSLVAAAGVSCESFLNEKGGQRGVV